jgi:hypothetical protein
MLFDSPALIAGLCSREPSSFSPFVAGEIFAPMVRHPDESLG